MSRGKNSTLVVLHPHETGIMALVPVVLVIHVMAKMYQLRAIKREITLTG